MCSYLQINAPKVHSKLSNTCNGTSFILVAEGVLNPIEIQQSTALDFPVTPATFPHSIWEIDCHLESSTIRHGGCLEAILRIVQVGKKILVHGLGPGRVVDEDQRALSETRPDDFQRRECKRRPY